MELDGYDTDLSDYHLQETPFYESQTIVDIAMLRAPEKFAALKPSPVSIVGNTNDAMDVAVTVLSMPTTNKKKRVTFLPNFVQVSAEAGRHVCVCVYGFVHTENAVHDWVAFPFASVVLSTKTPLISMQTRCTRVKVF